MTEGVDARGLSSPETDKRVDLVLSLLLKRRSDFYTKNKLGLWIAGNKGISNRRIPEYRQRAEKLVAILDSDQKPKKLSKQKGRDLALIDRHLAQKPNSILHLKKNEIPSWSVELKLPITEFEAVGVKTCNQAPLGRLFESLDRRKNPDNVLSVISQRTNRVADWLLEAQKALGGKKAGRLIAAAQEQLNTISNEADRTATQKFLSQVARAQREARLAGGGAPEDLTKTAFNELTDRFTTLQADIAEAKAGSANRVVLDGLYDQNRQLLEELGRRTNLLFGQLYYLPVKEEPVKSQAELNSLSQKVKYIQNPEIKEFLTHLIAQKTAEAYKLRNK